MNQVALTPLNVAVDIFGQWRTEAFVGMVFCTLLFLRKYPARIGWEATVFWAYCLISALYIFEFPAPLPFGDYQRAFEATAGASFAEALLIPLAILSAPAWIWRALTAIMVIEIALVSLGLSGLTPWDSPAMSFDTALLACYLPFAPWWLAIASVLMILTHHGSTALTIMAVQIVAISIRRKRLRWYILPLIAALAYVAYFHSSIGTHINSQERLGMWDRYMASWLYGDPMRGHLHWPITWSAVNWRLVAFGFGPGTFQWIALMVDKFFPPLYFFMHNDWLQFMFELGVIGFVLATAVFVRAVRNVWTDTKMLAAVFGCGAFAMTYHPLRYALPGILVALIFRHALTKKTPGC